MRRPRTLCLRPLSPAGPPAGTPASLPNVLCSPCSPPSLSPSSSGPAFSPLQPLQGGPQGSSPLSTHRPVGTSKTPCSSPAGLLAASPPHGGRAESQGALDGGLAPADLPRVMTAIPSAQLGLCQPRVPSVWGGPACPGVSCRHAAPRPSVVPVSPSFAFRSRGQSARPLITALEGILQTQQEQPPPAARHLLLLSGTRICIRLRSLT